MSARALLGFAAALTLACAPPATSRAGSPAADPATGELAGTITLGPACPAESSAAECAPEPAAGVRLIVRRTGGDEVARPAADERGAYAVALPAGRYRVELEPRGIEQSKQLPAEVEILAGRTTQLDVAIDTGIR